MGRFVGYAVAFVFVAAVIFGVGFSSGLSWSGNSKAYSEKDGSLSEQLSEQQMEAVRVRVTECLPVNLESYLDACLQGKEKEWEPTLEEKKDGY